MIIEKDLIPYNTSQIPAGPWLVFSPHADDETFGMGGSLLLAADREIRTTVVFLTDGSSASNDINLKDIRRQEAQTVCGLLGVNDYYFWDLPDRELQVNQFLISKTADIINEIKPQTIFIPMQTELHPDHRKTAELVWSCLKQSNNFFGQVFAYEICSQGRINQLIDISAVVDRKRLAMSAYVSQQSINNYTQIVQSINIARTYTLPNTVLAAEGFWRYDNTTQSLASATIESLRPYWQINDNSDCPVVSVIVRTRNRKNYLREALQSLSEQTYSRLEVIVINDGGEDIKDLISSFSQLDIILIQLSNNLGRSKAANIGLDRASGKYLAFLDDDDLLEPDHIANLVLTLEHQLGIKAVYSAVRCIDGDGKDLCNKFGQVFDATHLLAANYIPIHSVLFARELVLAGCRMDESLDVYEDWDFWIQVSSMTDFRFIDKVTAVYRVYDINKQSGFGGIDSILNLESKGKASLDLFVKWLPKLSEVQLKKIMKIIMLADGKDAEIKKLTDILNDANTRITDLSSINEEQNASLNQKLIELSIKLQTTEQDLNGIKNSKSWQLTKPLRFIDQIIKNI